MAIEWLPIETAPRDERVLLWYPEKPGGRVSAVCRVGILRNSSNNLAAKPEWWAASAGGMVCFPDGPVYWSAINAPE